MSAEKSRGRHAAKPDKKTNALLAVVLCIVAVMLVLVGTVLYLMYSGRSALMSAQGEQISVPVIESDPEEYTPESINSDTMLDTFTIRKNGKVYKPRENMITLLALGVDEHSPEEVGGAEFLVDARADMVMLAAIDMDTGRMSFISLSRDTICNFDMYASDGTYTGQGSGQLALSYRYGDGGLRSCELTRDAVSELFGGITINGCAAMYMDGFGLLNDAVGGVTVTIDDDYKYDYSAMKKGETVTLNRAMAEHYIRTRAHTETGNLERMERQKQYFKALLRQMIATGKENPASVISIYNTVSEYMVTDLSLNEIAYLASQILKFDVTTEFINVPGEVTLSADNFAEFHVDRDGLTQILLDVYYEEVQ